MKHNNAIIEEQPSWCCADCGKAFGRWWSEKIYHGPKPFITTYHIGMCDVCLKDNTEIAKPRDFGYLRRSWNKKIRYALGRV
jgi:hypothetical protein